MNTSYALLLTHGIYLIEAIIIISEWHKIKNKLKEIEKFL